MFTIHYIIGKSSQVYPATPHHWCITALQFDRRCCGFVGRDTPEQFVVREVLALFASMIKNWLENSARIIQM